MAPIDNEAPVSRFGWLIEDADDVPANPAAAGDNPSVPDAIAARLARRDVLKGLAAGAAVAAVAPFAAVPAARAAVGSTLTFAELSHGRDEDLHVAPGYTAQVLLRWGDPVAADAPRWDPMNQTAEAQAKQFGYNNDFVGFLPLPAGSNNSDHGLLVINNEYTDDNLMFPGGPEAADLTKEQADVSRMAHGLSIIEIIRDNGQWSVVEGSKYARRITPDTPGVIAGPASGSERLVSLDSPDGVRTLGTYGNCAGGVTPWGTVLTGEENVQNYFMGDLADVGAEAENYRRFSGIDGKPRYGWAFHHARWQLKENPNEPNHVGWIAEIDPYDPASPIRKRTTLGRCKHEGANVFINGDGRVVAYTGDDQRFEYVYRFVSAGTYDPGNRAANIDLLDDGELSVAEFTGDKIIWHPLVFGQGPLTAANGFTSQGDVVIEVRKAADLVGATPMDRPEDIEVNPVTGTVFLLLTNNARRGPEAVDKANPRHSNLFGHIIEFMPPGGDHTAAEFGWDFFIFAGNPNESLHGARYHDDISANGWFANPDNCAFDSKGRLWVATDGAYRAVGVADGLWACDVSGEGRGLTKHFLRTPHQAELCGPFFTPDDTALFCAVQHPAERTNFDTPATRWPDFKDGVPPRPSLVVVTRDDGGPIGG